MNTPQHPIHKRARRLALVPVVALALAACSSDDEATTDTGVITDVGTPNVTDVESTAAPAPDPTSTPASLETTSSAPSETAEPGTTPLPTDVPPASDEAIEPEGEDRDVTADNFPDECRDSLRRQVELVVEAFGEINAETPARDFVDRVSEEPPGLEAAEDEYNALGCDSIPTDVEDEVAEEFLQDMSPELADLLFFDFEMDWETCDDALAFAEGALDEAEVALDLPIEEYFVGSQAYAAAGFMCEPDQLSPELEEFYAVDI